MTHKKLLVPLPFEELPRRYVLRVSGDREEAADLFQETWLHAYRACPWPQPEGNVPRGNPIPIHIPCHL
jgi:hypothetical protein